MLKLIAAHTRAELFLELGFQNFPPLPTFTKPTLKLTARSYGIKTWSRRKYKYCVSTAASDLKQQQQKDWWLLLYSFELGKWTLDRCGTAPTLSKHALQASVQILWKTKACLSSNLRCDRHSPVMTNRSSIIKRRWKLCPLTPLLCPSSHIFSF